MGSFSPPNISFITPLPRAESPLSYPALLVSDLQSCLRVSGLAEGKGHIAVLDHVLYLPSHGEREEDDPVDEQHRPEH